MFTRNRRVFRDEPSRGANELPDAHRPPRVQRLLVRKPGWSISVHPGPSGRPPSDASTSRVTWPARKKEGRDFATATRYHPALVNETGD